MEESTLTDDETKIVLKLLNEIIIPEEPNIKKYDHRLEYFCMIATMHNRTSKEILGLVTKYQRISRKKKIRIIAQICYDHALKQQRIYIKKVNEYEKYKNRARRHIRR